MHFPEIWASPEPTIARVSRHVVRDQLAETGHFSRASDIGRLASLGIHATRYPILWERCAPYDPARIAFRWADERLQLLRDAGIEPIVTLLHHGSGPWYTSLVDPAFPALFAAYAGSVARRFPWVRRWTPINEPLTTARFSTLYGTWYPNGIFDHTAFGRAIVNEALAIARAMHAIREYVPDAQLLLTEDLQGFTAGDPGAAAYVEHKCERSFLSAELLLGRVRPGHALYEYLRGDCNVPRRDLDELAARAAAPDVMGYNYYPNSERFVTSEGAGRFGNVPMVDVDRTALDMRALLRGAHERLGLPLALSEVHVIGSERERARWLLQRFADLLAVRAAGVDVRAFGAWAAFGMVDWTSLLCQRNNIVEDGLFTFAGPHGEPQPTLAASVLRDLARGTIADMPAERGWWEREQEEAVA